MNRVGSIAFTTMLVASVVTAAAVLHARTPDLALEVTDLTHRISPGGPEGPRVAQIRFFVRESDPNSTVEIVGPNEKLIKVLYRGPLLKEDPVSFTWDGRTASGEVASPEDRYRLRVIQPGRDRDMVYPRRIDVEAPPG